MISLPVIIMIAVLLVFALVAPLCTPFYRTDKDNLPQRKEDEDAEEEAIPTQPLFKDKPVSIIITVHDNAHQLEKVIDSFLSQEYNADYQVVIIIDETEKRKQASLLHQTANIITLFESKETCHNDRYEGSEI